MTLGPIVKTKYAWLATLLLIVVGFGWHVWWPLVTWLLLTFSVTLRD